MLSPERLEEEEEGDGSAEVQGLKRTRMNHELTSIEISYVGSKKSHEDCTFTIIFRKKNVFRVIKVNEIFSCTRDLT